jgi:peptide/nickel transport system permease protein
MTAPEVNSFNQDGYWRRMSKQFFKHRLGTIALLVVIAFCLVGVYAPFLASSKPILVKYDGLWYFPLFRYLFYTGFFTKRLDIFFNLLIFTMPIFLLSLLFMKRFPKSMSALLIATLAAQFAFFTYFAFSHPKDPAADVKLSKQRFEKIKKNPALTYDWNFNLQHMNSYAKLNMLLRYKLMKEQQERLKPYQKAYGKAAENRWLASTVRDKKAELLRKGMSYAQLPNEQDLEKLVLKETPPDELVRKIAMPSLWNLQQENEADEIARTQDTIKQLQAEGKENSEDFQRAQAKLNYILDRRHWIEQQSSGLSYLVMPLLRPFHWEDDAGGSQNMNHYIGWWELTRINRKDLVAALIFGVRISIVVGIMAVGLAIIIGVPIGALAGFYGGKFDIVVSRLLEIWESMPTFFMLLMVVAIAQSKSIFLIIGVIGIFGWTGFSRYVRGEFFKQRNLSYVEACHAMGFRDRSIIFSQILPNAIPPVLTLLPFAVMTAITSEAGLSFLGLGEEDSCSWGVLMDEGRSAFPGESYLLWPPAILLTILLIAIALVGDALRDALDPKMQR